MRLHRTVIVAGSLALLLAAYFGGRYAGDLRTAVAVRNAHAAIPEAGASRSQLAPIKTLVAAEQALRTIDARVAAENGLDSSAIANTRPAYTFDDGLGNFAAGTTVYRTPVSRADLPYLRCRYHLYPNRSNGERAGDRYWVRSRRGEIRAAVRANRGKKRGCSDRQLLM